MTDDRSQRTDNANKHRNQDSIAKRVRVEQAIAEFMANGTPISVTAIQKHVGCSRQFIYDHFEEQVKGARRIQKVQGVPSVGRPVVTPTGLQADLLNAQQEIADLRRSVAELRAQLRNDLGARLEQTAVRADDRLAEKQQEVERLISERRTLERDASALRRQVRNLTDELAAERAAHQATARMNLPDDDNVVPLR